MNKKMNNDIKLMIELQGYWTNILNEQKNISRNENSISHWKQELKSKEQDHDKLGNEIKQIKITINQKETDLADKDDHLKKLLSKKNNVKTEKELTAVDHETAKTLNDKNTLEDDLIGLFDTLEKNEKELTTLKSEVETIEKQTEKDIAGLEEKIQLSNNSIEENRKLFDAQIDRLSHAIKAKFTKLITSPNGIGIARLQGEICDACNFQIPFNLTQDIKKDNSIITCTNCGRYLYH
jgi:uncharacterized protein